MEQVQDIFYDTTLFGNLGLRNHISLQVVAQQSKIYVQRYCIIFALFFSVFGLAYSPPLCNSCLDRLCDMGPA